MRPTPLYLFQFPNGSIKRLGEEWFALMRKTSFNSLMVRLKAKVFRPYKNRSHRFQFPNGSIKRLE